MSLTFDSSDFEAGLTRLIREVEDQTQRAVQDGLQEVERAFDERAKVLTGEYRNSWRNSTAQRSGEGYEAVGGPTVPYARKQEKRNQTVAKALQAASARVGNRMADAWQRGMR